MKKRKQKQRGEPKIYKKDVPCVNCLKDGIKCDGSPPKTCSRCVYQGQPCCYPVFSEDSNQAYHVTLTVETHHKLVNLSKYKEKDEKLVNTQKILENLSYDIFKSNLSKQQRLVAFTLTCTVVKEYFQYSQPFYLLDKQCTNHLLSMVFEGNRSKVLIALYYSFMGVCHQHVYGIKSPIGFEFYHKSFEYVTEASQNRGQILELIYTHLLQSYFCFVDGQTKSAIKCVEKAKESFKFMDPPSRIHEYNINYMMYTFFVKDLINGVYYNVRRGYDPLRCNSSRQDFMQMNKMVNSGVSTLYGCLLKDYVLKCGRIDTTVVVGLMTFVEFDLILQRLGSNTTDKSRDVFDEKFKLLDSIQPYIKQITHESTKDLFNFIINSFKSQFYYMMNQKDMAIKYGNVCFLLSKKKKFYPSNLFCFSFLYLIHFYANIDVSISTYMLNYCLTNGEKIPGLLSIYFVSKIFLINIKEFKEIFEKTQNKSTLGLLHKYHKNLDSCRSTPEGGEKDVRKIRERLCLMFGIRDKEGRAKPFPEMPF